MEVKLKPKFIAKKVFLESIVAGLCGFFLLGFYGPVFALSGGEAFANYALLLWGLPVISFLLPMPVWFYWKKLTYQNAYYDVQDDKIEYSESFLNAIEKEVFYERIIEVILKKSVVQRYFGLGTIVLQTHATSIQSGASGSGIKLMDLENSESAYKELKEKIRPYQNK